MIEVSLPSPQQLENDLNVVRAGLLSALKAELTKVSFDVSARVKDQKLSGQVLKVKTGRLRRSINAKPVTETETGVEALVGTNVEYARIHEFGFKGSVNVREHMRKAKGQFAVRVRAHARKVNLPERSFLRSSLDDMRGQIDQRIAAVIGKAIAGSAQ